MSDTFVVDGEEYIFDPRKNNEAHGNNDGVCKKREHSRGSTEKTSNQQAKLDQTQQEKQGKEDNVIWQGKNRRKKI